MTLVDDDTNSEVIADVENYIAESISDSFVTVDCLARA